MADEVQTDSQRKEPRTLSPTKDINDNIPELKDRAGYLGYAGFVSKAAGQSHVAKTKQALKDYEAPTSKYIDTEEDLSLASKEGVTDRTGKLKAFAEGVRPDDEITPREEPDIVRPSSPVDKLMDKYISEANRPIEAPRAVPDPGEDVRSTSPVDHRLEKYLARASGDAPSDEEQEEPEEDDLYVPDIRSPEAPLSNLKDKYVETAKGKPIVKDTTPIKLADREEETAKEDVDHSHIDAVSKVAAKYEEKPKHYSPSYSRPLNETKENDSWIRFRKAELVEEPPPKEPPWLELVRQRRWRSTVKGRFPSFGIEKHELERRSTTPKKQAKFLPPAWSKAVQSQEDEELAWYLLQRRDKLASYEDAEDVFDGESHGSRDQSLDRSRSRSKSPSRRSSSTASDLESDWLDKRRSHTLPLRGPIKEYGKNLALERSRAATLRWQFSCDNYDLPVRTFLPKPVDLEVAEEFEKDIEDRFKFAWKRFEFPEEEVGSPPPTPPHRPSSPVHTPKKVETAIHVDNIRERLLSGSKKEQKPREKDQVSGYVPVDEICDQLTPRYIPPDETPPPVRSLDQLLSADQERLDEKVSEPRAPGRQNVSETMITPKTAAKNIKVQPTPEQSRPAPQRVEEPQPESKPVETPPQTQERGRLSKRESVEERKRRREMRRKAAGDKPVEEDGQGFSYCHNEEWLLKQDRMAAWEGIISLDALPPVKELLPMEELPDSHPKMILKEEHVERVETKERVIEEREVKEELEKCPDGGHRVHVEKKEKTVGFCVLPDQVTPASERKSEEDNKLDVANEDTRLRPKSPEKKARPWTIALDEFPGEDIDVLPSLRLFSDHRRKIKPSRHHTPSQNHIRQRQTRTDLRDQTESVLICHSEVDLRKAGVKPTGGYRLREELHHAAKAGLQSVEDLSAVTLKQTSKDAKGISVERNDYNGALPVMLLQVKGLRHVQTRLVEPAVESLNSGDVFVLITSDQLFLWIGRDSNIIERAKGAEVANIVQQQKLMQCNASKVIVIEEGKKAQTDVVQEFWQILGGEKPVNDAESVPPDADFERGVATAVLIYRIQDNVNPPKLMLEHNLCGNLPSIDDLNSTQAFVLDFGSEVYVWLGRFCSSLARKYAIDLGLNVFNEGYTTSSPINPLNPTVFNTSPSETKQKRPPWCLFAKSTERSETILFKQKFLDWPDPINYKKGMTVETKVMSHSVVLAKDIEVDRAVDLAPSDSCMMIMTPEPPSLILDVVDVGRGLGSYDASEMRGYDVKTTGVKMWHIKEYGYTAVPEEDLGHFHSGESYVVEWSYQVTQSGIRSLKGGESKHGFTGRDAVAFFFWHGKDSSQQGKGAAALLTVELDLERKPQIMVTQGKEPPCFFNMFMGKMVIHQGKRQLVDAEDQSLRMYLVTNEETNEVCLVQIPECCSKNLRSRTSYVILDLHKSSLFVWHGAKSASYTQQNAKSAASSYRDWCQGYFKKNFSCTIIDEGEESDAFWKTLGNKEEYCSLLKDERVYNFSMRIYQCSSVTGTFESFEVVNTARSTKVCPFPAHQAVLYNVEQPALFLIDTGNVLYLWQGWWPAHEEEAGKQASVTGSAHVKWNTDRKLAMQTAKGYAEAASRDFSKAAVVFAGLEPLCFRSIFPFWEERPDVAEFNIQDGKVKDQKLNLEEELTKLSRTRFTLEELLEKPPPEGVDPARLDSYLSEKDFEEAFKMSRTSFSFLPQWKRLNMRKSLGLF